MNDYERRKEIISRFNKLIEIANELFDVTLPNIKIKFDLKGQAAGYAGFKNNEYYVRFNTDMIQNGSFEKILNETIPHELAHIVNFYDPNTGNAHDNGWKHTCELLGGKGKRNHDELVLYAKGKTYEYLNTHGTWHRISGTIHKRIQEGQVRICKDHGLIHNQCEYKIIN